MRYRVLHRTTYDYDAAVEYSQNIVHLTARDLPRQRRIRTQLRVTPESAQVEPFTDPWGNAASRVTIVAPHQRMMLTAENVVDVADQPAFDREQVLSWEQVIEHLRTGDEPDGFSAFQYAFDSIYVPRLPELADYAQPSFTPGRPLLDAAADLNARIYEDFTYDPRSTTISTPVLEVLSVRRGVCQDFAHLFIGCLRSLGLACRYVSGYLRTDPKPGAPRMRGVDASHAWVSVYCPPFGWVDFDPTNNNLCGQSYITLAWALDFHDVSPVKGVVMGGGGTRLTVAVDVDELQPSHAGDATRSARPTR